MMSWYKGAADELKSIVTENHIKKVDGYDFISEYLKENQPDIFADIDFSSEDDIEEAVRSNIDQFEEWLKVEANDWLYISKGYRWFNKEAYGKQAKKEVLLTAPNLSELEASIVNRDVSSFSEEDYNVLLSAYDKSNNLPDKDFIATCAHRIAEYNDNKTLPFNERADFWSKAGEHAIQAGKPGGYKFFRNAAWIYARESAHHDSARLYKQALDQAVIEKLSKDVLLSITRECRKQFELSGEVTEAANIFIQENNIKFKQASDKKEKVFLFFLKWLFNYGESPSYVASWSVFLVIICAFIYWANGLCDGEGLVNSIGISLYYSVVTFTTLGYGDFTPASTLVRTISAFEAVFGLFLTSTFLVTFVRKYSR